MTTAEVSSRDARMMQRALELAAKGLYTTKPNPRAGCVIAHGEEIVAESWHSYAGTAHAEIEALEIAGGLARNADLYVTLEPCAMCAGGIVLARLARVVFGAYDAKAGACGSLRDVARDCRLNHVCDVQGGVLQDDCSDLITGFFAQLRRNS